MCDDEREYLDFLTQLIHELHHRETRQQIDELLRDKQASSTAPDTQQVARPRGIEDR
jgi:hypothetical protein